MQLKSPSSILLAERSREQHGGFTLVELLVVIAIITLLISLVVPVVSSSMRRASQAKALSNFRQMGTIITMFAMDNKDRLPGPLLTNQRSGYRQGLPLGIGVKLWKHMGIPEPTAEFQPIPLLTVPAVNKWRYAGGDPYPGAYSVIRDVLLPDGTTGHPFGLSNMSSYPMKLSQMPSPSSIWAIWERGGLGDPLPGNRNFSEPIHGDRRTVMFFDGHAEAVPSEELPAYIN